MSAPASVPAATSPLRGDIEVLSLVGFVHATSHFFHLLLPPLFPWLMPEFGMSYTQAGALMTGFFVASGTGQALAGFVVDRLGAYRVLSAGIALFGVAAAVLGLARGYPMLLAAAVLAGLGNSVFHPADFTLLNHRVSQRRLGAAFSVHGLSGNLGWAAAPLFMTGLAAAFGWRTAAFSAALVALASLAVLLLRRGVLADHPHDAHGHAADGGAAPASLFAFLAVRAVWMCFLFFLVSTLSFGALQNFAPTVLQNTYGLSLRAGASALTLYLLGSAAGIAVGGWLAARAEAHDRVIALALVSAATVALGLATGALPSWAVAPAMVFVGFCTGSANPSRDLLVRRAAMARFGKRSFGRIYGFVYSGLDVGLAAAPLVFGGLLDRGMFRAVLVGVAVLQVCAVIAAVTVGRQVEAAPAAP